MFLVLYWFGVDVAVFFSFWLLLVLLEVGKGDVGGVFVDTP